MGSFLSDLGVDIGAIEHRLFLVLEAILGHRLAQRLIVSLQFFLHSSFFRRVCPSFYPSRAGRRLARFVTCVQNGVPFRDKGHGT